MTPFINLFKLGVILVGVWGAKPLN